MLRMHPIVDAKRAEAYYAKSDGGYYLKGEELHREFGGKGASRLGLSGAPAFDQFKRLVHGLDPNTGKQLTAKLIEGRIPAWDVTASVPKGVTMAIERGDSRVRQAMWQAAREAMSDLEALATTRVRKGGRQEDRVTGNLIWYADEHAETRPMLDESLPEGHRWRVMPDPDRHIHFVVFNATFDPEEREWKAVKFRPIMDQRKYFDRRFDHRLAAKLSELGYEIKTAWKPGGGYYSWDIAGFPEPVIKRNSRRSGEIAETEAAILAAMKAEHGRAPKRLSTVTRDKLGATSRLGKREDLTLAECRSYWDSRLSDGESRAIGEAIKRALRGENPKPKPLAAEAVRFSLSHHFEQRSVVPLSELSITAMERSMGAATLAQLEREMTRQGVIVRTIDGQRLATTKELQREEEAMVAFAANGRGSVCPVGLSRHLERGKLNDGQWQAVCGLLGSSNRVNLVEGPAGAGKSWLLKKFAEGMRLEGESVTYLATTTDAAAVLKTEGFQANTLARFLLDEKLQAAAKGGRVVVDEASMLGHADAFRFFQLAERLDLKLILVGDPMQHGSVPRGALMRILKEYAGVTPFRLSEIMRQEDAGYRAAAMLLSEGKTAEGFDALDGKGWVREIADDEERYRAMAAEYVSCLEAGMRPNDLLIVSPTHAEAARITQELRSQLRAAGRLGAEERAFTRLVAANASEAERGQRSTYRPGDVLQFHQNAKGFTKGQRLTISDPAQVPLEEAAKFQLYRPEAVSLAAGDRIRFTGTVKSVDGKHKLGNGSTGTVAGFTEDGILLENGWEIGASAGHFRPGFVETSFGSQGRTVKRVLLGMAAASLPATNQEQMYVSSSRAKERMTLYTDDKDAVRAAVLKSSQKLAALDLKAKQRLERVRKRLTRRKRFAILDRLRAAWEAAKPQLQPEIRREASRGR